MPDKALKVLPEHVAEVEHSQAAACRPIRQAKQVDAKTPQQAQNGVKNRLEMRIYAIENECAFSPCLALSELF
jgi:hypothetical protein